MRVGGIFRLRSRIERDGCCKARRKMSCVFLNVKFLRMMKRSENLLFLHRRGMKNWCYCSSVGLWKAGRAAAVEKRRCGEDWSIRREV
jgi:hypothetical protein